MIVGLTSAAMSTPPRAVTVSCEFPCANNVPTGVPPESSNAEPSEPFRHSTSCAADVIAARARKDLTSLALVANAVSIRLPRTGKNQGLAEFAREVREMLELRLCEGTKVSRLSVPMPSRM